MSLRPSGSLTGDNKSDLSIAESTRHARLGHLCTAGWLKSATVRFRGWTEAREANRRERPPCSFWLEGLATQLPGETCPQRPGFFHSALRGRPQGYNQSGGFQLAGSVAGVDIV